MSKRYKFVDLTEFYNHAKTSFKNIVKPIAHLSFDDGLRECYDVIMPILIEKGIPATFFINSGFAGNKEMLFRFKASILKEYLKSDFGAHNIDHKYKSLMQMDYSDDHLLEKIAFDLGISFKDYLIRVQPYMNWEQIKELQKNGFTIGSHSIDHPEFRKIALNSSVRQIKESFDRIVNHIDIKIRAFSFPFTDSGLSVDVFDEIFNSKLVDITFGTAGLKNDVIPMNFQRIPMEWNYKANEILNYYKAKSIARSILRRNIINR
ncbi:MAG: polysaccharide deacetylase family protein [Bacteroidales bacterium]|nr:polysaccharide deacetylase family protein [Bacteroidales bacterium]